jgi:hypothetical protein
MAEDKTKEVMQAIFAQAKRDHFGPPYDDLWGDEQLDAISASEIQVKQIRIPPDSDPLMRAAQVAFPDAAPQYHAMIVHRYRDVYDGIPEADAVHVILQGYSSPAHAMQRHKLKRRPLKARHDR